MKVSDKSVNAEIISNGAGLGVRVDLEWYEVEIGLLVGRMRKQASIEKGIYTGGKMGVTEQDDQIAACAELAVAKFAGLYYSGSVNVGKEEPDIAPNIQVRHTKYENGSLIVRKRDRLDHYYVLVTGSVPVFWVRGYIWGAEARRSEWLANPHGWEEAWFVPQSGLTPMDSQLV